MFFSLDIFGLVKAGIEIAKEGIDAVDKALDLYNKVFDQIVPWKTLNETIEKLDKFRQDYSQEAANLIGNTKTLMMDGMDAYFRATQSVYEWCGLAVPLLKAYKKLYEGAMNQGKFTAQRTLLLKVLDDGIAKMEKAQDELAASSKSFNDSAGKLTSLKRRLQTDFDEKSEYFQHQVSELRKKAYIGAAFAGPFGLAIAAGVVEGKYIPELKAKMKNIQKFYDELQSTVAKSFVDIDETKAKLKEEIRIIGDLKTQTEETRTFIGLDDTPELKSTIIESVDSLIKKCTDYRTRHIKP